MKKILFGITSLTLGGAERVLVDLANELSKTYEVTIFTLYAEGELEKQLNDKVRIKTYMPNAYAKLTYLQKHVTIPLKILLFQKRIYQKRIKENYDVEIAFLEGPITRLFSTKNINTRKIAWIHNDISKVFGKGIKAKIKRKIDEKIYSQYEKLIFVSKDNLNHFKEAYPLIQNQKQVIYNYLKAENILKKAEEETPEKWEKDLLHFVTVARLVKQKGIDRLLKVHKRLIEEGLTHQFLVIGDGEEKENLQKYIQENQLEKTFILLGKRENPYPYIKKADCFCLFSRFEGYGMVLEEAKILNKPILITDTAAREAVENYENCEVAENTEEGIYLVLKEILTGKKELIKKEIADQYENTEIIETIKKLIEGEK